MRRSTKITAAVSTAQNSTMPGTGSGPTWPTTETAPVSQAGTVPLVSPWVLAQMTPSTIVPVARVTMSELALRSRDTRPLTRPMTTPTAITAGMT